MTKKRLLVPVLKDMPYESGFGLITKIGQNIIVRAYKESSLLVKKEFIATQNHTRLWEKDLDIPNINYADLITVETTWLRPDQEGYLLFRGNGQEAGVLTSIVPSRSRDYKFTPILHQSHFNFLRSDIENLIVFSNLRSEEDVDSSPNEFNCDVYDLFGNYIANKFFQIPANSTTLISVEKIICDLGLINPSGVGLRIRGGSSQFAIFHIYKNVISGSIGIEHSLPPYYYAEAVRDLKLRGPYMNAAFGDLK